MAMPAAEDRATTVTKVVSATYGSTELHAFQRAIPASDQVAVVAPVGGAAPAMAVAMTLLIATVPRATTRPSNAMIAIVMTFAVRVRVTSLTVNAGALVVEAVPA